MNPNNEDAINDIKVLLKAGIISEKKFIEMYERITLNMNDKEYKKWLRIREDTLKWNKLKNRDDGNIQWMWDEY